MVLLCNLSSGFFGNMEGCLITYERHETFSYPHVNVVHFHEHSVQKRNHRMFRYSSGKFDNSSEGQTITEALNLNIWSLQRREHILQTCVQVWFDDTLSEWADWCANEMLDNLVVNTDSWKKLADAKVRAYSPRSTYSNLVI